MEGTSSIILNNIPLIPGGCWPTPWLCLHPQQDRFLPAVPVLQASQTHTVPEATQLQYCGTKPESKLAHPAAGTGREIRES